MRVLSIASVRPCGPKASTAARLALSDARADDWGRVWLEMAEALQSVVVMVTGYGGRTDACFIDVDDLCVGASTMYSRNHF